MKYLAVAGFAALAVATPALDARDSWEPVKKVETTTWANYPVPTTTKKVEPATWYGYGDDKKKADPAVWDEWNKKPVYTTTVVTAITTYCPEPTTMVHAGKTYVVTKATTITITDCPCTISVPVYVKTSTSCDGKDKPEPTTWAPVKGAETWSPVKPAETWVPVKDAQTWVDVPAKTPVKDASTWAGYPASTSTGWNPVATWKGAADKVNVGAGLAGVVGIAALLL